jgi:hypothetical protein
MICPFCQREVGQFAASPDGRALRCPLADCPGTDQDVPNLYVRDYDAHPPVALSILGPTGHGKTMFIEALLTHLERHVRWPGFSTQWMDETGMREVRARLRELRQHGQIADATARVFPRPKILRLRKIPGLGGRQVLMYDTSGESFATAENVLESGRYVRNSPAIVCVVSVTEFEHPEQLSDMMTSYDHAMSQMGADARDQALILVLTKGDLLLDSAAVAASGMGLPPLPDAAREFLENDDLDPAGDAWARLETVHAALDEWLQRTELRNTVNLLKDQFRTVRFTIVSAQGRAAIDQALTMDLMPRGILAPLLWLCRVSRPGVWVETKAGASLHLDLAAAIEAAPDGAVIRLERGTTTLAAPLNVSKALTLVGTGAASSKLVSTAEKYAIGSTSALLAFRGLTLEHAGGSPADLIRVKKGHIVLNEVTLRGGVAGATGAPGGAVPGAALLLLGACEATLSGCTVTGNAGGGVSLRDPNAVVRLKDCVLSRNAGGGVAVHQGGATLFNCTVEGNGRAGLELVKAGSLAVERGTVRGNGKSGVRAAAGAAGAVTLTDVAVEGHAANGVDVLGTVALTASGLTSRQNNDAGVRVAEAATAVITGGKLEGNKHGLVAAGKARADLKGVTVSGNADAGALYAEDATGCCLNSAITCNGNGGLRVYVQANVAHRGNSFEGNTGEGVVSGPKATLSVAADPALPQPPAPPNGTEPPVPLIKKKGRGWFG